MYTVKGWAKVIPYPDVYVIENMAVVALGLLSTEAPASLVVLFALFCTRYDKKNSKANEGGEVQDVNTN